ncbi:hypothetical protein AG0111_0g7010 [Alternaria gaisen]|uniref:Uncharacterized protein n=1 Tax=Alternaria gaisen TaxID=167740 RepID=A0ACB6FKJ2_9PLEO|nr:hypothetical protein AG0111_0g7010 [Alternaria gaisen]
MYAELQAQEMKLKKKEEAVEEVRVEPEKKRSFLSLCLDQRGNAKVRAACNESTDIIAAMEYLFQERGSTA